MSCSNTLEAILKTCDANIGGITKLWINNSGSISGATGSTGGEITAATLATGGTGATVPGFVEFQFNPNTSNYVENSTVDLVTGSTFYDQTVTLVLNRREKEKRQKLLLIASGQPSLTLIIKDSNAIHWIFGLEDDHMFLTGNEGGSGTAKSDANGYTLTFTCQSSAPAYVIKESAVLGLLAT